jgi:hypothetical protein
MFTNYRRILDSCSSSQQISSFPGLCSCIAGQTNTGTWLINLTVQILNQAYTDFRINVPVVTPACLPGYIHFIPAEKISLNRQNRVTVKPQSIWRRCRRWGSHSGGHEGAYLLGCHKFSRWFLTSFILAPEYGGEMFLWNVGSLSTDYAVSYPKKIKLFDLKKMVYIDNIWGLLRLWKSGLLNLILIDLVRHRSDHSIVQTIKCENKDVNVLIFLYKLRDRLCGLTVTGPGFDSRRYQILWQVVGLVRGPLSFVRITKELLE